MPRLPKRAQATSITRAAADPRRPAPAAPRWLARAVPVGLKLLAGAFHPTGDMLAASGMLARAGPPAATLPGEMLRVPLVSLPEAARAVAEAEGGAVQVAPAARAARRGAAVPGGGVVAAVAEGPGA